MEEVARTSALDVKYRLIAELGEGGMADVYLGVANGPRRFHKLVVLKVIKRCLAGDPEFLEMFSNEARLAARLNHSNVVQTYEVAELSGRRMIVMEYLEGQTFARVVEANRSRGGFGRELQLRVLADALAGLHHAHELRNFDGTPLDLVHRDVSPQNIIVTFDGVGKVLDFGIAKAANFAQKATNSGMLKGKLRFMAPEQINAQAADRRADIFCLGLMLWEVATGMRLWEGEHEARIVFRISRGDIPRARDANPDVPPQLDAICARALAFAREDRYATAAEMQADIEEYLYASGARATTLTAAAALKALFEREREQTRALIEERAAEVETLSAEEYATRFSFGRVNLLNEPSTGPVPRAEVTLAAPSDTLSAAQSPPMSIDTAHTRLPAGPSRSWSFALVGVFLGVVVSAAYATRDRSMGHVPEAAAAQPTAFAVAPVVRALPPPPPPEPSAPPLAAAQAETPEERPVIAKSVRVATRRPAASAAAPPPPKPQVSCDPPFYVDAEDIRRPKLECL